MPAPQPLSTLHRTWIALTLTWIAGFVDAVGYLTFARIYTANMSGNSIAIGMRFAEKQPLAALARGWPVVLFLIGLFGSDLITDWCKRRGYVHGAALVFGLEALLLCAAALRQEAFGLTHAFWLPVALLSLAMGLQNATLTKIGALTLYTTHVTGTLTRLAAEAARFWFWFRERTRGRGMRRFAQVLRLSPRQRSLRRVGLTGALWCLYVSGAVIAAIAHVHLPRWALFIPVALLCGIVAVDLLRPITGTERRDERPGVY